MKVEFTAQALADLDQILAYTEANYPGSVERIEARIRGTVTRIGMWPESSQQVLKRPGVPVVPLLPFPYKLFYEIGMEPEGSEPDA